MAVKRSTGSAVSSRKSSFFGCQLREDEKEYHCKADKEQKERVVLRTMCLDASAREELHMVEIEVQNNKTTIVNLASLQPNVVNTVNLGVYELRPPFTFRLTSGSGPVYICGQHFNDNSPEVEEQENNSSPVKRPSKHVSFGKSHRPSMKRFKLVGADDTGTSGDDSGSDVYETPALPKETIDLTATDNDESSEFLSESTSSDSSSSDDDVDDDDSAVEIIEQVSSQPQETTVTVPLASPPCKPPLSVGQIKSRIKALAIQGHVLPKTQTDFSNFVLKSYRLQNEEALKKLWNYTEYIVNSLHK